MKTIFLQTSGCQATSHLGVATQRRHEAGVQRHRALPDLFQHLVRRPPERGITAAEIAREGRLAEVAEGFGRQVVPQRFAPLLRLGGFYFALFGREDESAVHVHFPSCFRKKSWVI